MRHSIALLTVILSTLAFGCEEAPAPEKPKPKATASAPEKPAAPAPAKSAEPEKLREDCPEGSSGVGTSDKPCDAKGADRMMEVAFTKMTEEGPQFKIVNKSKLTILWGNLVVYFYDKSGKQLSVTVGGESKPYKTCSGKIFAGVMKPGEKATMNFSCVKKSHVPEGAETIEAELMTAGFADASGEKTEFYWRNAEIAPEARPKGGIKAEPAAKKK